MTDTRARTQPDGGDGEDFEHEVMAQCVDAWHAGGSGAVEAVLAKHPGLAPLLRERLAKLERAGLLGPVDDEPAAEIPEQLGEFKLLRRLGSGGMGVVFVAEQTSLGRTVALKLVRPEQRFFPGARARFRREVEAIARLGDAGIVPIYGVGQDQGIDFFAMEYVRGASLGEVIAALHGKPPQQLAGRDFAVVASARAEAPLPAAGVQLPEVFGGTWVQATCRIVARMARAAQHAHDRGVVHRDLKPNNAMVTPDGRVLLLDFGLAAASGSSRITRSGAMLGTLHYMAPEQLGDGDVDARSDVYALGVTLHELLSLRSPFTATSDAALRTQIVHGARARLAAHNPEVPLDVQTIAAVAMDVDPARRYATAQALADDLERFLQHRPIAARPIGAGLRAVRWGQRHPAQATALVLAAIALAVTPLLVRLSRGDADERIRSAEVQARANLESALRAVEGILANARSQALTATPGLDPVRKRQVDDAHTLAARLLRENPDDTSVRTLYVRAMLRVAELRRITGDHGAAIENLAAAEPVLTKLREARPGVREHDVDLAGLLLARGTSFAETGRVVDATGCWKQIVAQFDSGEPREWPLNLLLAIAAAHNNLGRVAHSARDADGAIRHLQRCRDLELLVDAKDLPPDREVDHLRTLMNLASVFGVRGDAAAAREQLAAAQQRVVAALERSPGHPDLRREQARVQVGAAALLARGKQWAGAVALREGAVATMRDLVAKFPDRMPYASELAEMTFDLSVAQQMAGAMPAAETTARDAIALAETLVAKVPGNLEYPTWLARYLRQWSGILYRTDRESEASTALARAVDVQGAVVRQRPDDPIYRLQAAELLQELALHRANADQWPPAREALVAARDHYEHALQHGGESAKDARRLPQLLMVLSQAELMCDDFEGVVRALTRLQALRPMPAAELEKVGKQLHVDDRADFQELLRATRAASTAAPK